MINWTILNNMAQLDHIMQQSHQVPCLIFKHSTRCSVSTMAKNRLENKWQFDKTEIEPYFLDLLQYRPISNQIAAQFAVEHQSPQILLVVNGKCIYDESHNAISVADIADTLAAKV
jgi:bacillithiol system protein YtxJ